LEIFSNRFYKNLDDGLLCGEMTDNDIIVCFELPCHAQQSRTYKKQPDDPFVIPVFLSELTPSRLSFSRGPALFGYPFVIAIERSRATSVDGLYDAVVDRLQRWTSNARDLFTWEAKRSPAQENGDAVTQSEGAAEEGDIVDEKSVIIQEQNSAMDVTPDDKPRVVGTKKGLFSLRLQSNHKEYATTNGGYAITQRFVPWEVREGDTHPTVLLREHDAFVCEFDENMKAYYFGDDRSRWEHAQWDAWEEFLHPEFEEARKVSLAKRNKGISIQDCLNEFTKVRPLLPLEGCD
jgi:ubiquitin carboxyl-terminal hydrolase 4/11/15